MAYIVRDIGKLAKQKNHTEFLRATPSKVGRQTDSTVTFEYVNTPASEVGKFFAKLFVHAQNNFSHPEETPTVNPKTKRLSVAHADYSSTTNCWTKYPSYISRAITHFSRYFANSRRNPGGQILGLYSKDVSKSTGVSLRFVHRLYESTPSPATHSDNRIPATSQGNT